MTNASEQAFESLLEYLSRSRGFDFTGYKRSSLARRVEKRMGALGVKSFADYLDYLEVHPEEFPQLFNTILINVTAFFRDPAAWEVLEKDVIPQLVAARAPDAPLRIWSAGCASGEEAYTLAILLAEALGMDAFVKRVKIYATDIDGEALAYARQASYGAKEVAGVPPALFEKYFERSENRFLVHKDLRRAVIFGRHDLIQDAPISRIDLLTCRNTLMYFNAETQAKVLARLHFALNDGGVIFLGKAEMLLTHANLFQPIDLKRRIFKRNPKGNPRDRLMMLAQNGVHADETSGIVAQHVRVREAAFEAAPVAQLVVDAGGSVALANERARSLFAISTRDVGRALQDLEVSYRPVELRSCLEQAYQSRRPVHLKDVQRATPAGEVWLDVDVVPLFEGAGRIGALVSFVDVTSQKRLQDELRNANTELEAAYEELQSTSEELETTNQELQSTVEELETTNEELQSTNEELETMNEELQSTNEELQTINDELRQRGDELNQVNGFLSSILSSLRAGVVVLDRDLQVNVWNKKCEDLWGLRADEVKGKSFMNLDIGLPVQNLRSPIEATLTNDGDHKETTVEALNRRGRTIRCRVSASPLGEKDDPRGVVLLIEDDARVKPLG